MPLPRPGAVFDGNALDKTTELLAIEMALGYPCPGDPQLTRDPATQRIDVAFVIEQGFAPMSNGSRFMATRAPAST